MEQVLIEYIANSLWQAPLLAVGAWLLLRMARPDPLIQHRVWLAVLALAVILPMHGIGPGSPAVVQVSGPISIQGGSTPLSNPSWERHRWQLLSTPVRPWNVRLPATATHWVVGFYLSTIFFGLARIGRARCAARRLVERASETTLPRRATAILEDYCDRRKIKPPRLLVSCDVLSPAIVGVMQPVLLLPVGFTQHTEDEVEAALLHELAHVGRRDYLMSLVFQVSALPVAWHPVIRGVQQRIRRTREMICDAIAAREMRSEIGYARCLVSLSQSMLRGRGGAGQVQAMGLFDNNILEERLMRLMATETTMSVRAKVARAISGGAVMIAATAITVMFHVTTTMAQSEPAAMPEAAQSAHAASQALPALSGSGSASPMATAQGDKSQAGEKKGTNTRRSKGAAGQPLVTHNKECKEPTPDQQRRIEKEMAEVQGQVSEATAKLNSPEFKRQIANAQRQVAEATAKLNNPEVKRQMADAQRQAAEATAKLNGPEFKRQMADVQRQVAEATAKLNSPEFKREMADAQRQAFEARTLIDSPEFKKRMEDAEKQLELASKYLEEEMKLKSDHQK